MKNFKTFVLMLIVLLNFQLAMSQDFGSQGYALLGKNHETILLKQTVTKTAEIFQFDGKVSTIFGLAMKVDITFDNENSLVRIILVDKSNNEFLVYETYPLLETKKSFSIDNLCEETGILDAVKPQSLRIEVTYATVSVKSITYSTGIDNAVDFQKEKKEKKNLQNNRKIQQINNSIKAKGLAWVAGNTNVSELTYSEKKKLYGQSKFPAGFEYYVGGIVQSGDGLNLKSATASSVVENWDWRNRHGKNWITSVKDQSSCGSCWAFAAAGAAEAQVNLFYNQLLNMNLSEQDLLSCSGAGSCSGGYPSIALDYIKNTGIVNEEAFPYSATNQVCTNKSSSPTDQIKIGGRIDFGSTVYPVSEDNLKKMIIKYGPLSGGLLNMSHAMTLVGWLVVKEGDKFLYYDINKIYRWATIPAGSSLIGKTVWLFKNSWGGTWGDGGYFYVETDISNFAWTHAISGPVQSLKQNYTVQCVDNDKDGYYWWGLGAKPANCPDCPSTPDGNDFDATLGPIDANGNFVSISTSPVADFSSNMNTLTANGSVNFSDISTNNPNSWSWTFEGGTPATSTAANPIVTYKIAGKYDVALVVSNAYGSDTKIKIDNITVNPIVVDPVVPVNYCASNGNASKEWITGVSMNGSTYTSVSSGRTGYENFTAKAFNVIANKTYSITLTPKYSGKVSASAWSVWIDFNHDSDFNDPGEQVLVASNLKAEFSKSITIPSGALTGPTRMRVSMKRATVPLPCEAFAYGEVEDFTINISAPALGDISIKSATIGSPATGQPVSFKLFPNPVSKVLNLIVEEVFEQDAYSIYNITGALMNKKPFNSTHTQVDVSNLPAGIYLIKVENGNQTFQEKFIKER
jgi:PKD repeat protein